MVDEVYLLESSGSDRTLYRVRGGQVIGMTEESEFHAHVVARDSWAAWIASIDDATPLMGRAAEDLIHVIEQFTGCEFSRDCVGMSRL
jgi:hypothetical protein